MNSISNRWTKDIKIACGENDVMLFSSTIPCKSVLFAWNYAIQQAQDIKRRQSISYNFWATVESIFLNKLAEITFAFYLGYTEPQILSGKSPISLNGTSKNEINFVDAEIHSILEHKILLSGTKKFNYPTTLKRNTHDQVIVYIDAKPVNTRRSESSCINISPDGIKTTIIGLAEKETLNLHQDSTIYKQYSQTYTSFVGLNKLVSVPKVTWKSQNKEIIKVNLNENTNYSEEMQKIQSILLSQFETPTVVTIDYNKLFENMI